MPQVRRAVLEGPGPPIRSTPPPTARNRAHLAHYLALMNSHTEIGNAKEAHFFFSPSDLSLRIFTRNRGGRAAEREGVKVLSPLLQGGVNRPCRCISCLETLSPETRSDREYPQFLDWRGGERPQAGSRHRGTAPMPRGALASALVAGTLCAIWALAPSIIPPPHLQLPAGSVAADVVWRLPVGCDFSGFFVELLGYVVPLTAHPQLRFAVDLGQCSAETLRQLAPREARALQEAQGRFDSSAAAHVLVDHAEPCAWKQYTAAGGAVRPWVHIGRTMTESADLSPKWLACIRGNRVHEIWVPTPFHVELFARAGVHNAVAVPEAVDTDFFAPVAAAARQALPLARHVIRNPGEFVLVSVFKWEHRKGWDVLLDAYWAAFSRDDPVTLVLCSYVPGWEPGPARCRSYLCGKYAAT